MASFIIAPNHHAANTAATAVRKSLENRNYEHYIIVYGKHQGTATVFSHLGITTDRTKAEEKGYITPKQWLEIFNNPMKFAINQAKAS